MKFRTCTINGIIYYCLQDISKSINVPGINRSAINDKKIKVDTITNGGIQKLAYVTSDEAVRLIMNSRNICNDAKKDLFLENSLKEVVVSCHQVEFEKILRSIFNGIYKKNSFDREVYLFGYRLDFFIHEIKLNIEYDESHHSTEKQILKDIERDVILKNNGVTVVRINHRSRFDSIPLVMQTAINLYSVHIRKILNDV
jgi:very-short-patch-repair endonuclease